MGFFSSIGGLFGGSKSVSQSGLGALPSYAQDAYKNMITQASGSLLGGAGTQKFSPLGQTAPETQAFQLMQQPTTAEGVKALTANYMNPLTSYITDAINREASGNFSAYKSMLADSGQMGSNRAYLNSSAADEARLNAIGGALAGQYNNAQSTGLAQNQQTIANLLGQGDFTRSLDTQTKTADVQALMQLAQLLGTLPNSQTQTSKNYGNGLLGTILSGASSAAGGV